MSEPRSANLVDKTSHNSVDKHHFRFTAPQGYFLPSLPSTDPAKFDPITCDFGLIPQNYNLGSDRAQTHAEHEGLTHWQQFTKHVEALNEEVESGTKYHVLYLARHGQGYHNLAESYFGVQAWDCYWSELKGDSNSPIVWADAHLSRLGEQQAREQAEFWSKQLADQQMPSPSRWFSSPMERACRTLQITFQALAEEGKVANWRPTVKEFLRETNGIHTCDWRSSRSVIASRYSGYDVEPGFTENDELWDPVYRETNEAHTYRAALVLDDILSSGDDTYTSITAHGGMINAILRAIGHREFQLRTGSALAVLVKTEQVAGRRPQKEFGKGETKPSCESDPLKAGLPGYSSLKEYVDKVEAEVAAV